MGMNVGGGNRPRGIMTLKPEAFEIYYYTPVTQNGCQIRLYPQLNERDEAMPMRSGRSLRDIGDWICGDHYGIRWIGGGLGKDKLTMLLTIDGDEKLEHESLRKGVQIWNRIRDILYGYAEAGFPPRFSHWSQYIGNSTKAPFGPSSKSRAKPMHLARGLMTLYMREGKPTSGISRSTPKLNCVFSFGPNATKALRGLLDAQTDEAANYHGDDLDRVFKYNSRIVHPVTGCLINFGAPGRFDQKAQTSQSVSFESHVEADDEDRFAVEATVLESDVCAVPMHLLQTYAKAPWSSILRTWKDERDLLSALEVGVPDDLMIESFRDRPDLLSDRLLEYKKQLDRSYSAGTHYPTPQVASGGHVPRHATADPMQIMFPTADELASRATRPGGAHSQPVVTPPQSVVPSHPVVSHPDPKLAPAISAELSGIDPGNAAQADALSALDKAIAAAQATPPK